ncbi:hypothetical protein KX928_16100 [Roseobacter sp. YSTF-M11]|uniref:4Fe-4S ferredoxin-type domain-containing protein n=1 Tax=Roseobacter insulae TaxID=2859783 RepID=A0A9X1FYE0_9RHOB|nr:hypothetical protein [Roseobacter insulae]MBW4709315.1 hypothetical protein [Roseobacter insulae]
MKTPTAKTPQTPRPNCIGCTDCQGLCREIVDLAFLPETVLHRSAASP